jgi:hypothetical protein
MESNKPINNNNNNTDLDRNASFGRSRRYIIILLFI